MNAQLHNTYFYRQTAKKNIFVGTFKLTILKIEGPKPSPRTDHAAASIGNKISLR